MFTNSELRDLLLLECYILPDDISNSTNFLVTENITDEQSCLKFCESSYQWQWYIFNLLDDECVCLKFATKGSTYNLMVYYELAKCVTIHYFSIDRFLPRSKPV